MLLASMVFVNELAAGQAGAASAGLHREVVLETDGKSFRFVSQAVRAQPLRVRGPVEVRGGYRVEARGPKGQVVHTASVADPLNVHYDAVEGGKFTGGVAHRTSGQLVVQLPVDAEVRELAMSGNGASAVVAVPELDDLAPAAVLPSTTLVNNGPSSQRVDVVFLGDGYTSSQLELYRDDVDRFSAELLEEAPFSEYDNFFNVHRVDVTSNQSGTDGSSTCGGTMRDTALDTGFRPTGIPGDCRNLETDNAADVMAAAASAPAADIVIIVVNAAEGGGSASYTNYSVFSRGGDFPEDTMRHEVGHSFGELEDEYFNADGSTWSWGEPDAPNLSTNLAAATAKWGRWVVPGTLFPTPVSPEPDFDVPGYYKGAYRHQNGIYRPTFDSKMRTRTKPFDRVSHAVLVDRIFDYVPNDASPPSGFAREGLGTAPSGKIRVGMFFEDPQSYILSYRISNYADFRDSADKPAWNQPTFSQTENWAPLPGPGPKTIYVRVTNGTGLSTTRSFVVNVVPASTAINSGTWRSGSHTSLVADDDSFYEVNSVMFYGFISTSWWATISNVPNSATSLRVKYRGANSAQCTQSIKMLNDAGVWVLLDSRSVGTTEQQILVEPTGNLADYVSGTSGNGQVRVWVGCYRGTAFHSKADQMVLTYS
ncbi:M64 family metallopeptidase [Catellatospora sp. NPDC049609]|uniref:M64 family metallopeptidase n=1 Tax=Catellatospora sp. NPDC049609 TaxID=3155505 RepID=UPI00341AED4E